MYESCLVCHAALGTNRAIVRFPVGSRVAFEPETGRIWAVCKACGEWNLAPIEDRWEAVEECSEIYDGAILRAGVDEVGLAKVGDLELIRLGHRASPELMTLRYSHRVRSRRRRARAHRWLGADANLIGVAGGGFVGALLAGSTGFALGMVAVLVAFELADQLTNSVVLRLAGNDGGWIEVRQGQLRNVRLVPEEDGGWSLRLKKGVVLRGTEAIEAARYILPLINRVGLEADDLRKARNYVRKKGEDLESVFAAAARRRGRQRTARLSTLDPHIRLALEILASEESERRALVGDVQRLGQAWRHAAELAVIQDGLLHGPGLARRLALLRS